MEKIRIQNIITLRTSNIYKNHRSDRTWNFRIAEFYKIRASLLSFADYMEVSQ
jgi:hypothetical protein